MQINFGIVALSPEGDVLHFCGYEEPPGREDFRALEEELRTDPEFGLVLIPFKLAAATPAIVQQFRSGS